MNKTELIAALSEETNFSKKDIARVLESFYRIVARALKKGEKVSITGFGSFWLSVRAARKGMNPLTKAVISIPAMRVPKFKASKKLKGTVCAA